MTEKPHHETLEKNNEENYLGLGTIHCGKKRGEPEFDERIRQARL